jgi:hypothetical protein
MINSIFGSQIIFKVKSGFLQEEDVKIVSKQIKDRIGQYRSRGNVVESQSKTSEVTQESQQQQQQPESAQNVTRHGTSNSPAQSGEKHTQISNQVSIEMQPGQSTASQSNVQTQTPVSQQHSLEIPTEKLHQTSEQSTSDSADTQQSDSHPETGILCCRY